MAHTEKKYGTSFLIPFELRARIDALRMRRGRRSGSLPPKFAQIVIEALENLIAAESRAAK